VQGSRLCKGGLEGAELRGASRLLDVVVDEWLWDLDS
jgi:hypothetical protein